MTEYEEMECNQSVLLFVNDLVCWLLDLLHVRYIYIYRREE